LVDLVPDAAKTIFLIPDEQRQRETFEARGAQSLTSDPVAARANVTRRNVLLARLIRDEAVEAGFPTLPVDRPLAAMIELVDAHFPSVPRARDLAATRLFENDVLARQVRLYRSSGDAPPGDASLAFACECGAPGCADVVELTLADYEELSVAGDRSPLRRPRS
jgi:hypothetical protein